jgi:hypothetical protein
VRTVRFGAVASAALTASAVGHALGGGALPSVPALAAFALPLTGLVAALGRTG